MPLRGDWRSASLHIYNAPPPPVCETCGCPWVNMFWYPVGSPKFADLLSWRWPWISCFIILWMTWDPLVAPPLPVLESYGRPWVTYWCWFICLVKRFLVVRATCINRAGQHTTTHTHTHTHTLTHNHTHTLTQHAPTLGIIASNLISYYNKKKFQNICYKEKI